MRRDIVDIRDEYGLPYRNQDFRLLSEAEFPALTSVFDKDTADLVLETPSGTTGGSGVWLGPQASESETVVIQGLGVKDHLLAFLPSCASSSVVIKLRGYPGDYYRVIALPLHKWFPEQPNAEFPLVLNTGRTVEHWHTRTKTGKVPILERLSPNAWVEMNPRDARQLRLKPQDKVDVVSRRGRVRGVELRLTETVAPGQIFVPFHYVEANANQMTQSAFDPFSREPNYKQSAVRVERFVEGGLV